jgi:hypothetical protein
LQKRPLKLKGPRYYIIGSTGIGDGEIFMAAYTPESGSPGLRDAERKLLLPSNPESFFISGA